MTANRAKGEFWLEACEAYAKIHGVALAPKAKPGTKEDIVKSFVLEQIQSRMRDDPNYQPFKCNDCQSKILNEDTFCWRCGGDVSENDDGGFERYLAEQSDEGMGEGAPSAEDIEAALTGAAEGNDETTDDEAEKKKAAAEEKAKKKAAKEAEKKKKADEKKAKAEEEKKAKAEEKKKIQAPAELVPDDAATPVDSGNLPTPATAGTPNRSIQDRVANIKRHIGATGISAYEVGMELYQIQAGSLHEAAGYQNFEEFLAAEIGMSRSTAFEFIRIAENIDPEYCKQIPSTKLRVIASGKDLPKPVQKKLLKAALPTDAGGENATREKLASMVREAKAAERAKKREAGETPRNTGGRPPKPKISPLKAYVGEQFKIRIKDGETKEQPLDDQVKMIVKRTKTQITIDLVDVETEA